MTGFYSHLYGRELQIKYSVSYEWQVQVPIGFTISRKIWLRKERSCEDSITLSKCERHLEFCEFAGVSGVVKLQRYLQWYRWMYTVVSVQWYRQWILLHQPNALEGSLFLQDG